MQKISVGGSIAGAYGFLFGRMFPIIGLAWLPALLYSVGAYLWLQNVVAIMPAAQPDAMALVQTGGVLVAVIVIVLLLHATIAISLTQEALGVRKDIALAHLVIGPRELRLFLAYVRLYLIFLVGYVALVALSILGITQATRFAATGGKAAMSVGSVSILPVGFGVVSFVLLIAFILSILRLAFLIAPIAAVEHHASLVRSWRLTKGSAWRIVGVILCVFLPVLILTVATVWFLSGDALAKAVQDMMAVRPPDARILLKFEASHAFDLAAVGGVVLVVMAALQAGATAAAYRTVTGHEEEDSEDDAALVAPLLAPVVSPHNESHVQEHDAPISEVVPGSDAAHGPGPAMEHADDGGHGEPPDGVHAAQGHDGHVVQASPAPDNATHVHQDHAQADDSHSHADERGGADHSASHEPHGDDHHDHVTEDDAGQGSAVAPDAHEPAAHDAEPASGALDPAGLSQDEHGEQAAAA